MNNDLPIQIRNIKSEDIGYLLASFTRELHKVEPYNFIPNSIFFPFYTQMLDILISKSTVLIAHLDDSPDDIVGYLIGTSYNDKNIIIHWMQVKAIYRRFGVAKELLTQFDYQNKNIICSHYFKLFKTLKTKYNLIFDPTILGEFV